MISSISSSTTTPTAAAHAATNSMHTLARWNSPIPYLFGGLAIMLGLIATALIILACSYRKSSSSSNSSGNNEPGDDDQEKPSNTFVHVFQPEMEPKIIIAIMPGDVTPTYLATVSNFRAAASSSSHVEEV